MDQIEKTNITTWKVYVRRALCEKSETSDSRPKRWTMSLRIASTGPCEKLYLNRRREMLSMSKRHMMGDMRIQGPMAEGASHTLPDGEPMAMSANGTSPPNASGQDTRDDPVAGPGPQV